MHRQRKALDPGPGSGADGGSGSVSRQSVRASGGQRSSCASVGPHRWPRNGSRSRRCRPEFQMPIMDVAAILDHLRSHHEVPGEWFRTPNLIAGLSGQGQAALSGLSAALNCFDQCARPWTVLAKVLLDRTWIAAEISRSTNVADRTRGICDLAADELHPRSTARPWPAHCSPSGPHSPARPAGGRPRPTPASCSRAEH